MITRTRECDSSPKSKFEAGRRTLALGAAVAVLALGLGWLSRSTTKARSAPRDRLSWGFMLQIDRPYYQEGATARVLHTLYNFSRRDVIYGPSGGRNGCGYRLYIRDFDGNLVWEPGSIVGDEYQPVSCPAAAQIPQPLPGDGGRIRYSDRIPLIYQNSQGNGRQGDPLPEGAYTIYIDSYVNAPYPPGGPLGGGGSPSASVPFKIVR